MICSESTRYLYLNKLRIKLIFGDKPLYKYIIVSNKIIKYKRGVIMAELKDLTMKLKRLSNDIDDILSYSRYRDYDDLSGVDYNNDSETLLLVEEYKSILNRLEYIADTMEYLDRPIKEQEVLYLNQSERYQIKGSNHYYTSGSRIEFLVYDKWNNVKAWHISSVEHNGTDYYIVGYPSVLLDGLTVRTRY